MTFAISVRPEPVKPAIPTTSSAYTDNDMFLTAMPIVTFSTVSTFPRRWLVFS
jgi:hypothetical protein